ncbi:hypothetical protein Tco_1400626 [Tanacetum coccineum]
MSDSEHSTVTYTSVSEDDYYMGFTRSRGTIFEVPPSPDYIPGPEGPPSPDYVPGPEEPEQAPPSPIYIPFVPEPVYPEFLPVDDEVFPAEERLCISCDSTTHSVSKVYYRMSDPEEEDPEEDDEEDPEEDPADYPADRGDDDDDAEEDEHLAPAEPAAVAYSVHSEGILLRTTVIAQQSEIAELQVADRRRQSVILDLLKTDYRRQRQLVEALKIVKSLKTQMIELQTQQGPAKDPAEPELTETGGPS